MEQQLSDVYINLKSIVDDERKEDFGNLMTFLEQKTAYLSSPASSKYHLSVPGGLLFHSCSVTQQLLKLKKISAPEISNASCVIVGLLHDAGKAGVEGQEQYIVKEPTDKQKQYGYTATPPYLYNDQIVFMEHETRSLYLIQKHLKLTEQEWCAIAYHNEPWNGNKSSFKKNKLLTLLQQADYWSALYLEDGVK